MKTIRVVAAVIRDGQRIFATQRGYGPWKDWWEFPGGKIEAGETPQVALVREIREELDTVITVGDKLADVEYDYPDFHLSMSCFLCRVLSGTLELKEHESAGWLLPEELDSVRWLPADREIIAKLKQGGSAMFRSIEPFPGIHHITDAMGVSFTLLAGNEHALLVDAGYGTEDVAAYVRSLTDRPVDVLLTHGHHDHVLGARWFPKTAMCADDLPVFQLRTARPQREAVRGQAYDKGLSVPEDFLTAPIPDPEPMVFTGTLGGFPCLERSLGGLDVVVVHVPAHTPGSVMVLVPREKLLLTGDDWNPCTWMWFAESADVQFWRDSMLRFVRAAEQEAGVPIRHVLCSHQPAPREGGELKDFLAYMTDDRLRSAPPVDMNSPIATRTVTESARGWTLIFDGARFHS